MAKLTHTDLTTIVGNETSAVATINANGAASETALENTLSRDGTSPNEMEANLDMNNNKILNLPPPTLSTEPLRKGDVTASTLVDIGTIRRVRVASTVAGGNIDLATGLENGDVVDGITLVTGEEVLVKDQDNTEENGIYTVVASGAAPRSPSYTVYNAIAGVFVIVMEGTANADTLWLCDSDPGGTLETTAISFTQFVSSSVPGITLAKTGIIFEGATDDPFETTLAITDPTADRTVTVQDATTTLVGRDTTDTLTLKSINLANNTITGTTAEFNTALSDENFATIGGTETLTAKTLTSPIINTSISGTAFLDEDTMSSDAADKVASQQSIKAYVDAEDANIASDTLTFTNKTFDADATGNSLSNVDFPDFGTNVGDFVDIGGGLALDATTITVTSDAVTVLCNVEQSGGGDVRLLFSDGVVVWDCTPTDSVALTAGSDTNPTRNYVYFLKSTGALTASTVGWPGGEFHPVAEVVVQSAGGVQSDGAYKVQRWSDPAKGLAERGQLQHIGHWIRQQHASWVSGDGMTPSIGTNAGSEDDVDVQTSSGTVLQLKEFTYPAFDTTTGDVVFIVNKSGGAFTQVSNLNLADETDAGVAITNNKWTNLVFWGVVNQSQADCKLMVNLPSGFHSSASAATIDAEKFSNYNIPANFKGVGFLIARVTLKFTTAANGTWEVTENLDLRGTFPSIFAGGSAAGTTEFSDAVFRIQDDGDATKEIAFQASGITTGTTRTVTVPDANVTIQGQGDVLDDLNTLGAPTADGEFIVATGAGAFAYETGATARTSIGLGTADNPQFNTIELGAATDTTLSRTGAGSIAVEGNEIYRAGGTDVPLTDGGTGASTAADARTNLVAEELGVSRGTNIQTGTTFTPALGDQGKTITLNNGSGITFTVPPTSEVAFAEGTYMNLHQLGAGQVTVSQGSGVTITSKNGTKLSGQYSTATIQKIGAETWLLAGDVTT